MHTNNRATWDVTYRGLPLRQSAWDAHLDILRAYVDGRTLPESDDSAHHEATAALHGDGRILRCASCTTLAPSDTFHWCAYKLTDYGRIYATQRL